MLQKTFEILYLLHLCLQRVLTLPYHISYHRRYCLWPDSLQLLVLIKTACIYVQYIRLTEGRIWEKNEWKRVYIFFAYGKKLAQSLNSLPDGRHEQSSSNLKSNSLPKNLRSVVVSPSSPRLLLKSLSTGAGSSVSLVSRKMASALPWKAGSLGYLVFYLKPYLNND